MYLLLEVRDGTFPKDIARDTKVDLSEHQTINDAIIYAEPHHMDEEVFVVVSENGDFGIIPFATDKYLPELDSKWIDIDLARYYFRKFRSEDCNKL